MARLGLRGSDVVGLRFPDLNWQDATPISAERNAATIWDETAQFLPRKSDDLRRQG
jgi:hypothetical protein